MGALNNQLADTLWVSPPNMLLLSALNYKLNTDFLWPQPNGIDLVLTLVGTYKSNTHLNPPPIRCEFTSKHKLLNVYCSYVKEPNTSSLVNRDKWLTYLFDIYCILSSLSWWIWHTAALFNLICVIVDLSQVFSLRSSEISFSFS